MTEEIIFIPILATFCTSFTRKPYIEIYSEGCQYCELLLWPRRMVNSIELLSSVTLYQSAFRVACNVAHISNMTLVHLLHDPKKYLSNSVVPDQTKIPRKIGNRREYYVTMQQVRTFLSTTEVSLSECKPVRNLMHYKIEQLKPTRKKGQYPTLNQFQQSHLIFLLTRLVVMLQIEMTTQMLFSCLSVWIIIAPSFP